MFEIVIVIISCFLFLTFVASVVGKEFFHPIFICTAYWTLFLTFSICISYYLNLTFEWSGVVPVIVLLYSFLAGTFFVKPLLYRNKKDNAEITVQNNTAHPIQLHRLKFLILFFSLMGLLASFIQLNYLGISIRSVGDVFRAANAISVLRYSGETDMPKYGLILMAFFYSGGFLGGVYYLFTRNIISKLISLLPVFVSLTLTFITGAKTIFLYTLVIWLAGYITTHIFLHHGIIKNFKKIVIKLFVVVLVCLAMLPVAQIFRGGNTKAGLEVNAGIISYFGSFNAFSIWWSEYEHEKITPFKYTMSGLHNIFFGGRDIGLFTKNITIGYFNNNKIDTNVYTIIRALIEDFTIYGAIIILFFTGFFMAYFYEKTKEKKISYYFLLSVCFSVLFWSFTVNILNYNTILLSWVISYLSLIVITKKESLTSIWKKG